MLRMDGFDVVVARSPAEAVDLYAGSDGGASYIAGGTDLLPNHKHRILTPKRLVALQGALPRGWEMQDSDVVIGAGSTLAQLARLEALPALARAASLVAGPQIRNMGTLGGNVLLDTRCLYYNQTEFWRASLGYCLKAVGDWCHVINAPKTCVATQSSDTVPVLLALYARLRLTGPNGQREISLRDLFRFDGKDHLKLEPGEVLTHVLVPRPAPSARASYQKIRGRGAIDFPVLGVALAGTFEGDAVSALEVVIGAVNPAPKPIRGLDAFLGRALDDDAIAGVAELVRKQTRPQGSVPGDTDWRRQLAALTVTRGLRALRPA